jgi:hypothetical protein
MDLLKILELLQEKESFEKRLKKEHGNYVNEVIKFLEKCLEEFNFESNDIKDVANNLLSEKQDGFYEDFYDCIIEIFISSEDREQLEYYR